MLVDKKKSYDDLKAVLEEWLNPDGGEVTPAVASTSTSTGVSSTKDVESAFDDLFNE